MNQKILTTAGAVLMTLGVAHLIRLVSTSSPSGPEFRALTLVLAGGILLRAGRGPVGKARMAAVAVFVVVVGVAAFLWLRD